MALDKAGLQAALKDIFDSSHPSAEAAELIAGAIDTYVRTATVTTTVTTVVTNAVPASTGPVTGAGTGTGTLS